jgi:hypothetical protein
MIVKKPQNKTALSSRLSVARETIAVLTPTQLGQVAGGKTISSLTSRAIEDTLGG